MNRTERGMGTETYGKGHNNGTIFIFIQDSVASKITSIQYICQEEIKNTHKDSSVVESDLSL